MLLRLVLEQQGMQLRGHTPDNVDVWKMIYLYSAVRLIQDVSPLAYIQNIKASTINSYTNQYRSMKNANFKYTMLNTNR